MSYLEPALPVLLVIGLIGLAGIWRRSKPGRRPWLLTVSIFGILLLSINFVAWILSRPLEMWYEEDALPHDSAEAIVILAGTVHRPTPTQPYPVAAEDTYERVKHGVWLFNEWKRSPVLACGGSLQKKVEPYAATMEKVLESEGVPREFIWIENRSRSTHECAVYASEILRQHGISRVALVVEASSMPRAAASFRKRGITVIPAPIRFTHLQFSPLDILPNWGAIALIGETFHEVGGLVWYRLRGWI